MDRKFIDLVPDVAKCSGCGECLHVCSKGAIVMQADQTGSLFPVIRREMCVGCGRCVQQCAYRQLEKMNVSIAAYAAVAKDAAMVSNSASGGMFAALAQHWIQQNGLVAGAVLDCKGSVDVYHILSDQVHDVQRMQGSKYVQSDAQRCYDAVISALKDGKQVLFSGTPCQVAAIRKLTGDPEHLVTIDLICHGVPPVKMLDDYITLLGKRFRGKIESFRFRDKAHQKSFTASFGIRYGKHTKRFFLRSYDLSFYKYFLEGANYRENCYSCPFARTERVSDLTIGDYWGIKEKHKPDFEAGKMPNVRDWSCVLVNTNKGRRLLEEHAQEIFLVPSKPEWVAADNHQLRHPTAVPENREKLMSAYNREGYSAIERVFIKERGGWMKYHVRLCKQLYKNARDVQQNKN